MNNYDRKLEKFFNTKFVKNTTKLLIIKNSDGSYDLFDRYHIVFNGNKYVLSTRFSYENKEFGSLRNAVVYCIFSIKNKINEAVEIYELDKKLDRVNFSIELLNSLIFKTKTDKILIYCDKLTEEKLKKNKLTDEISKYQKQANNYQLNTFKSNEKFVY